MATNQIIQYPSDVEKIRLDLIDFLETNGVMQSWLAKRCSLSNCSISLFLSSKRILVKDKLDIIKGIIYR